jgi:tetratricopeptide (TPR) repeat protein
LEELAALVERGLAVAVPGTDGEWCCRIEMATVQLYRGQFREACATMLAAPPPPKFEAFSIAALALAYAGDLDEARRLNYRGAALGPSMTAWRLYTDGEIENLAGNFDVAEGCYLDARTLAATAGIGSLGGLAHVGLVAMYAATGKVEQALLGYRALIDYWQRIGFWTQLWTTLRNAADLFEQLGDDERAATLRAAADEAPESSVVGALTTSSVAQTTVPRPLRTDVVVSAPGTREAVLELAQAGIEAWLSTIDSPEWASR